VTFDRRNVVVEATRHQCYGGVWYSNGQRFMCTAADAADLYALRLAKRVPEPEFVAMPPPVMNRELDVERPVAPAAPLQPQPEVAPTRQYRRRDVRTKFRQG
jgi:hypothetical protein